jgi:arylsulfatase A-like enzyme
VIEAGFQKVRDAIAWGTILGAAAWSAYAATELVFASLLFRFVRPYAVFTSWHWQLTGFLLIGFLVVGSALGAVAGLVVYLMRRTGFFQDNASAVLESAASITLVGAFIWNILANTVSFTGGTPVLVASLGFAALLLVEMRSARWSRRLGMLTNPWVISGVLLGVEQTADLLDMGSARELSGDVALATHLLEGILVVLIAGAVLVGRRLRPSLGPGRWALATVALGVVLIGSAGLMGIPHPKGGRGVAHAAATAAAAAPDKPNVLVIVMDTVRADHLSVYGYQHDTSPNLRALARDATLYTHAQSAADITLTSHASLFTGMYPSWHSAYCQPPEAAYGRELSKKVSTLAEILAGRGYTTLGVAANLYLRSDFGLERGFSEFRIRRPVPVLGESRYQLRRAMRRVLNLVTDTAQFDRLYNKGEEINEEFFTTLDQRTANAPFFAFLNYMDAHFPYIPPAPYDRKFPGKTSTLSVDDLEREQYAIAGGGDVSADYRPYCVSQYDGGIAYLDAQLGQIVAGLKQRNLYDNTMVVITSDHGEAFGERRRVQHGNSPYQNLLHVALLIKYPKGARKGAETEPVSLIDVAPTILNVAGFPVPGTMQGFSLLDAAALHGRKLFSETFPCPVLQAPDCAGCSARTVVSWPFKYIAFSTGKKQLFNLEADPDENRELAGAATPETAQLSDGLDRWVKTIPAQARQRKTIPPEEMKRLKSLGYVGGK